MAVFASFYAEFIETGYVHAALSPFRVQHNFVTDTDGVLNLPVDFMYATGLYHKRMNNAIGKNVTNVIKIYKDDEVGDALMSQLRPVSNDYPIAHTSGKLALTIIPDDSYAGNLHYLRKPTQPKYNYTITGRQKVYNPTGSVDLEWSDTYVNIVILKALEFLGINLSSGDIVQYAAQKTASNTGGNKA